MEMRHRDRTGWLGMEDSNSQTSNLKMAFEMWPEFPPNSQHISGRETSTDEVA
jgi:hypothetical protein